MSETEDVLMVRKALYGFLYRMYLEEPPRELAEDIINKKFIGSEGTLSSCKDIGDGFFYLMKLVEKYNDVDTLHEQMVDEYTRLFIGPHRLPVQPYESSWINGERFGRSLLEVKKDYLSAGIVKSKDYPEPEDCIAFELKFMHYLCAEELSADSNEQLLKCLNLQRDFLHRHLLKWVPAFCDALYESELSDFYKGVAKITKSFLALDDATITELLEAME
ncbi:MAG: Chaperone protein TorD [Candidatus Argoarchaeum ethanivorans]|uniref:Chaperone protein TorD n=1 Tax=Candidatus Argoarchaeum ethanivorans TaxID=2608793 RepID=A0A811T629_9EURY|nr:MAG: Chaperone protein TorD [Candidatus Argoarchaeum ethanivorans]